MLLLFSICTDGLVVLLISLVILMQCKDDLLTWYARYSMI